MFDLYYNDEPITIYEFAEAEQLIMRLSNQYAGDITTVSRGGRGRNKIEYYNYPCSFDIETTTVKPGEYGYMAGKEAPPVAFPYLFQWNIYGNVIMVRQYSEAMQIFTWVAEYFRLGKNRRLVIFDHNLGYEWAFFKGLWKIDGTASFALDEHHPVTLVTQYGIMFRDSYKMTNMSLETLTKDWSDKWVKDKEIMDYSVKRTPYTVLDDKTLIYSALDVLSLSDAIINYLKARSENIWTNCPTSTSFIRKELKKRVGVGIKKRSEEQKKYFKTLDSCRIDAEQYAMLRRLARGGNTHSNRKYTGLLLSDLCHFDIASSYPAQMVCYPEYPIGEWNKLDIPTEMDSIELLEWGGYCTMFDVVLINPSLKDSVSVPYIALSKMQVLKGIPALTDNGRYMYGAEHVKITIFGIEWQIIKQQYNYDDAVILSGYYAKKDYLPDIVRDYVLELYANKTELKGVEGKEIEYAISKTYVNGVYGMAYTDCIRDKYSVTENEIVLSDAEDPEQVLGKYQTSTSYFLPYAWGAMVACLGRVYLQHMIDAVGNNFVYCDTDSIFAINPAESTKAIKELEKKLTADQRSCGKELTYYDIKGRPHELGSISEEPYCEQFKTYGAKKYITVEDGKLQCTIAGVPKKAGSRILGTPERFQLGFIFRGSDTNKMCIWYNEDENLILHDEEGRPIECHANAAMLPVDYLLSISADYHDCLMIDGQLYWSFSDGDKNTIEEE